MATKARVAIRIDRQLLRRLDRFCAARSMTRTYAIAEALDWYLRARSRMSDPDFVHGMRRLVRTMVDDDQAASK